MSNILSKGYYVSSTIWFILGWAIEADVIMYCAIVLVILGVRDEILHAIKRREE